MFVELSYPIGPATTVLDPGIRPPQVVPRSRFADGKRNNTSYIEMFAHTGTHIDMPWHFNPQGKKVMDFPIEAFIFTQVIVLQIPKEPWQPVTVEELLPHQQALATADAVLIRTGNSQVRQTDPEAYLRGIPGLSLPAAQYLAGLRQLRCIGVDFLSIENLEQARPANYPVHHALLDRPEAIFLLEDANFEPLSSTPPIERLYLFPLRIEELEASPVTAVAEIRSGTN